MDQPFAAACELDDVSSKGAESERGAVDEANLPLLHGSERPALHAPESLGKEEDRPEWRPHVMGDLDDELQRVRPGELAGEALRHPLVPRCRAALESGRRTVGGRRDGGGPLLSSSRHRPARALLNGRTSAWHHGCATLVRRTLGMGDPAPARSGGGSHSSVPDNSSRRKPCFSMSRYNVVRSMFANRAARDMLPPARTTRRCRYSFSKCATSLSLAAW